ncbi:MAG: hypothetical protein ABI843_09740 [Dokdonella sp.]
MNFFLGFAVGVVAGPTFLAKVWPKVVTWWKADKPTVGADKGTTDG